ncbi:MAG: tetratricopeptide repeat protein [Caldisericota bacterium]|nr:tetratricopeptide repeat protein [Caldisericota bacterium]
MNIIEKAKKIKENDREKAIKLLEAFINTHKKNRVGAHSLLSKLYLKSGEKEKAIAVLKDGIKANPDNRWLYLMLGDLYYFDLEDADNAIKVHKEGLALFDKPIKTTMSPYRYFLKRLSNISYAKKDFANAEKYFELFIALEPSDFYASDFKKFAEVLINQGKKERAKEVLVLGIKAHPGYKNLYEFAKKNFQSEDFPFRERKIRLTIPDVERISIKTPLIKEGDNLYDIIGKYTKSVRKKNDIITISSCVAAMCEERMTTVDTIFPSFLARLVSHFVSHKDVPFGGAAPLANPAAMEIAIREVGKTRIIFATKAGAIGRIFGKKGWFYIIAGEQAALIDDPPAAIPPFDYAVIPGPKDSFVVSEKIAERTGCRAAVIDANDLGDAWAVGYSKNVSKDKLEKALSDNPAGNEDQQTPIVIVRGL